MENNNTNEFMIGDKTITQWEEEMKAPPITGSISYEDAEGMGILSPQEQQPQQENGLYNTLDTLGVEHPDANKQYEQLSIGESWLDAGKALASEASHILMPKSMEWNYESKTHFGENVKYGYRYLAGTAGFMAGGWGVAGIKGLANLGRAGSLIQKAGKIVGGVDIVKTGANATKAAQVGAKIANASLGGAVAGAMADFNLYRPEENEGHLADAFEAQWLDFLKTDENDTDLDAKLKNVVEGLVVGIGVGNLIEFGAKPLFKRVAKNIKAFKDGKNNIGDLANDQKAVERFANKADLISKVESIKAEADTNNLDASQLLIDRLHPEDNIEAQKMLKVLDDGDEIFLHSDGTWDRSVRTWDEAHKVSPEEYRKQLAARDEAAGGYAGDTAIAHQDEAVKHTWTNRGWIGENEALNKTNANKIVKNYKDKWQIDNNVKVEFVDGLKVNGEAVEGTTLKAKYQGKATKNNQNAIDKKKVQIQKIEDKITMIEGGNKEVTDPLDVLKEELRIAKNELKELQKVAKGKNKLPDITIKIDVNAKNPYAVFRAELEHARDIAKGEVPNQAERHFSRYEGMNEGEVASGYVHKKATGKAKAVAEINEINQIKASNENTLAQGYSFKENPVDTFSGEGTRIELSNKEGQPVGYLDYSVDDNTLHIEQIMNYSYNTEQYEKGVAEKLVNNLIAKHSDKSIQWDATTPQGMAFKEQYLSSHPETKGKTSGISTQEELDRHLNNDYNSSKGGSDEGSYRDNRQQSLEDGVGENQTTGISKTKGNRKAATDNNSVGGLLPSDTPTNVGGKNTLDGSQAEQLKLDFSQAVETKQTTQEITTGLVNGEVKPATKGDIEALVNKVEQIEPEISGFNWKEVIDNPEKYAKDIERIFTEEDTSGLVEALAKGDFESLEAIIKKELAAVKIMGELYNTIKTKGLELVDDAKIAVIETVHHLGEYIKGVKSGFGSGLQAQKGINEVLESYGASRLSSWTKEGIDVFAKSMVDALNDIINLNFTRGQKLTPQQVKQELVNLLLQNPDTHNFMATLAKDKDISEAFVAEIEKILNKKGTLTFEEGQKTLKRILMLPEYAAQVKAAQLAPDKQSFFKTIKDWMDGNGGVTSYYVHNLLSGVGSLVKNVTSGAINTVYFPARKLLASIDPFVKADIRENLRTEGWRTYKCMYQSWKESWQLMKEAFISGNGKLTDIGENTLNMNEGQFRGYHEIQKLDYYFQDPSKFWEGCQNLHSMMTRAMGATDEFMSQLNYRAITRSKALQEAERLASEAGKLGDEMWINEEADRIFKTKFDDHGKPLDVEALNEARTILYQNNLDGTMYNYSTGTKEQMREKTLTMKFAGGIQQFTNENWFAKCMFPFVKTGANILQMALDHNAIYMAASPVQRKLLAARTAEGALARSQCVFGMFSLGLGSMMFLNGLITGSAPADPKERKALFATGWKPYSFKVGDNYISYQGYEPIHGMLGFAADFTNVLITSANKEDEKKVMSFFAGMMPALVNNFLDKAAFRTGLKQLDLIMNPQDTEEWQKAFAQVFKGFLPDVAFVTNTKSAGEHDVLQPKTMYERVFYRYFPENWTPMDYRRNVFGEKQTITGLIMTSASPQGDTPEEEALEYLAKYGYTPSEIDDVIANTGLKISQFKDSETGRSAMDAMKEEMSTVTIQGMTLREAVRALVTSEEYQTLPDGVDLDTGARWGAKEDTKINAINDIFLMYKQRAKKNIMANSDYFVDSEGRTIGEAKEDIQLKRLQDLNNLY